MKRLVIVILALIVILPFPAGGPVLKAEYQPLSIQSVTCTAGLDPEHTPYLALDGNPETVWRTNDSALGETALVLNLSARARVLGLKIMPAEASFDELAIEYRDQGVWRVFTGQAHLKPGELRQWKMVDLSYDQVSTDSVRLHIYNSSKFPRIGSISEIEIYGITNSWETVVPFTDIKSPNSEELYRVTNLGDHNTNSNWETVPDPNGQASFVMDFSETMISKLKLFVGTSLKGVLSLETWDGKGWVTVPGGERIGSLQPGWNTITVPGINASKLRGILVNPVEGRLGGIGEVQVWSESPEASVKDWYDSGVGSVPFGGAAGALTATVKVPQVNFGSRYHLVLAVSGATPGVKFNGVALPLGQAFYGHDAVSCYKLPVGGYLNPGDNFITLESSGLGEAVALKIEELKGNGLISRWSSGADQLNDGLWFTPAAAGAEFEIVFPEPARLDRLGLCAETVLNQVRLQVEKSSGWEEIAVNQAQVGGIYRMEPVSGGVTAGRLRLLFPYPVTLNEILCWGSLVNQGAPRLAVTTPVNGQIYQASDHWIEVTGTVDQADAVVTVNGSPAVRQGERFSAAVPIQPVANGIVQVVTIEARNSRNEPTNEKRTVFLRDLPMVAFDQAASEYFVKDSTFTVSGTVNDNGLKITVNETAVALKSRQFSATVPLTEGKNPIIIKATDQKGVFFEKRIVVFRDTTVPKIMILNPMPDQVVGVPAVSVSGAISDLTPCTVMVNGASVNLDGSGFTAEVNLALGVNTISVVAVDKLGNQSVAMIKVEYVKSKPVLGVSFPVNNQYLNTGIITVKGTVTDTLPVMVAVNNQQAMISGNEYQVGLCLPEGWNTLTVRATNEAEVETVVVLKVLVDETRPLEFQVTADPADWTNNNRPTVTFGTTDQVSEIDRYELAIDNQGFIKVSSPYMLPVLSDGEHLITVKAVDKVGWETLSSTKVYIDTTPPVAVEQFKAVPGDQKVIITWKANLEKDLKSYILKRTPAFASGDEKTLGPEVTEYIDTEVENFKSYVYTIRASDHIDNIGPETEFSSVKPGITEVRVNPAVETKVEYENVSVTVPVGALPESKTLTITGVDEEEAQALVEKSMAINVSPVYSLGATTNQGTIDTNGVEFEKPVLISIDYKLEGIYQYFKESNLRAYYYNYKDNNWEVIPESYVNPEDNKVYFFTDHFSMFSVQASVAPILSPEQISNMGVSPGKGYFQNNQVNVSYSSGSCSVQAKDFTLPGKGGLDMVISRSYDTGMAQADWGVEYNNLFSAIVGFCGFGNLWTQLAEIVAKEIDKRLAKPAGSYDFGRGWRINFVWVEKDENGMFLHLPGGGMKKINWVMDGPGWGGQGHGVFECHAGEHFVLEQFQAKQGDVYSDSVKVGETWAATRYLLITKDGTKYHMDGDGRLQRVVNRFGNSENKFYYRSDKKLDYIIDTVGRRIQFTYSGNLIRSISAAGKTISYSYANDELVEVNDGGLHVTKYDYVQDYLRSGSQSISFIGIVLSIYCPWNWISVAYGLIPNERSDEVYFLSRVTTPFEGEYRISYSKYGAMRYASMNLGYAVMWYEVVKATRFQEVGSAYNKDVSIEYNLQYSETEAPVTLECNLREGNKRTYMLFNRFSNSVDKDISLLKCQIIYGENDRQLSSHAVEYDRELEAPVRVIDQTGGRSTVQEFRYDNWGNIIWLKNSQTQVESFYSFANTNSPPITHALALSSPYGPQTVASDIHDVKTGELLLNRNGNATIPQQVWYKNAANGNLLAKSVRHGSSWLETSYEYDEWGNITKMTSPAKVETVYEYSLDYNQALLTKVTLGKLTDADGLVKTDVVLKELGYDPVTFRKRWEKDARGYVTGFKYDVLGRGTMTVLPDDTDAPEYRPAALTGEIDRSGCRNDNPVQTVEYKDGAKTTTVLDPLGNRTDYLYDSFEHLVEIVKFKKMFGVHTPYSRVQVRYNDQGNIREIVSPKGVADPSQEYRYKTIYEYDEANRLQKIYYPDDTESIDDNPYKFYSYNEISNQVTVTDENGNETLIKKDAVDRVIEQTLGCRTESASTSYFSYDALGNKISEMDGRGNSAFFIYDDLNRLTRKILPAAEVLNNPDGQPVSKSPELNYKYDEEGNLEEETNPLGTKIIHKYDEMNREIETRVEFSGLNGVKRTAVTKVFYDLAGNKTKVVDPNDKATEFKYTARGWLKTQTDAMGGITSFTYDLIGNKTSETDPRGNVPGALRNSYTGWYFYDELNRIERAVLPDSTPPEDPNIPGDNPVITFEYDLNGNCIKETKPNGQVIDYTYNGRNWLLSQTSTLNGKSYITRFEYDGMGNKKYVYDNKGNRSEFVYDALNRPALTILPEGNVAEAGYDQNGNKVSVKDGKHNETKFEYDALNRLSKATDAEGGVTANWYNEDGKLTKQVSATGLVTRFYFNEIGLPLRVVDSLNRTRSFDYDTAGNAVYKKDPRGTETRFEYDDLYRVLRADLQNGDRHQCLSYEYDLVGNIKSISNEQVDLVYNDADGNYQSDPFNRIQKVKQIMPDGTSYVTQYRYDLMGNMNGIRYPNSVDWLTYEYDKMNRLVAIPGFAGTTSNPGFSYDENSAVQSVRTDNGVTTAFQRDRNGRVTSINASGINGQGVLGLNYVYDDANNIIQRNDNTYVYDKINRLTRATVRGVFEDKFTKADMVMGTADQDYYGEKDPEEDVTDLTQVKLDYGTRSLILNLQTEAENISRVELTPEQIVHRVPLEQIEIYYRNGFTFNKLERNQWVGSKDDKGRIIIKFTPLLTARELKIHCNYDDLGVLQLPVDRTEFYNAPEKLVTVYQKVIARTESYGYDAMGNRMVERLLLRKERTYNYQYYDNSNRLKTNGRYAYIYDENGNLIKKGNKYDIAGDTVQFTTSGEGVEYWEYEYDLLNQLELVKKNGQIVSSYIYDPSGFRVEKQGSRGKVHYVSLLNGEVGYKKEFSGGKEYSYIYVGGQKLARVNGVIGGDGKKFFYHNDHLGSALVVTDEYGKKVVERDFTPFGEKIGLEERDNPNPDEDDSAFTGKDWDEDIGLYYFNARWYDPVVGRFITEDPLADDPTLYVYGLNNPIVNLDPSGLVSINFTDILNVFNTFIKTIAPVMDTIQKVISTYDRISGFIKSVLMIVDPDNTDLINEIDKFSASLQPLRDLVGRWKDLKTVRYLESAIKMWNELEKLGYSTEEKARFLASYYDEKLDEKLPDKNKEDVYNKIAKGKTDGQKIVDEIKEGLDMGSSASINIGITELKGYIQKYDYYRSEYERYRSEYERIPEYWKRLQEYYRNLSTPDKTALVIGGVIIGYAYYKNVEGINNAKTKVDEYTSDFNRLNQLVAKHPVIALTVALFYVRNKDKYTQSHINTIRNVVSEINSGNNIFAFGF